MIVVVPTTDNHMPALWGLVQEAPEFWAESGSIQTEEEFSSWFSSTAQDPLTGMVDGEVIGVGYMDILYPGYYASVNILKRKGIDRLDELVATLRGILFYWSEKHDLEKLVGIVRKDNYVSRMLSRSLGFRLDGVLRHHRKVNGIWTDYAMLSILRGELDAF